MSKTILGSLKRYPLLIQYAQRGLLNFTALAKFVKENNKKAESLSLAAVSMDLRRSIAKLPKDDYTSVDFSTYSLQVVSRSNIYEFILNKNFINRQKCLEVIGHISKTNYFVSLVEGEKEMVVMTNYPRLDLFKQSSLEKAIIHGTAELGFISINFPIELRKITGIYHYITSLLVEANISIHSFHTIGGEILILVKNADLTNAQAALSQLLNGKLGSL